MNHLSEGVHFPLHVYCLTQAEWGQRIVDHLDHHHPPNWVITQWHAPRTLPPVIDDPIDFLPAHLPPAELVLALGDTPALPQLIPDLVQQIGAKAVIAPIDRNESLPPGLARQLTRWLDALGVTIVFPKPFCSLTETTYSRPPILEHYDNPFIRLFARYFGAPRLRVRVAEKRISGITVERDSACGCANFVAQNLVGYSVENAEPATGMLHHHYPCLASMNQDADYHDTLMHVSGNILREAVKEQVQEYLDPTPYLRPPGKVDA